MFTYTSKKTGLTVYEGATAFWVVNDDDHEEICIGDGTTISEYWVGTPEFYEDVKAIADDPETKEAYF